MEVYHGSPVCGMEKVMPKISSHGKPYVYAAKKRIIATLFLERWNDFIFNLGTTNDNGIEIIQLTERCEKVENILLEILNYEKEDKIKIFRFLEGHLIYQLIIPI